MNKFLAFIVVLIFILSLTLGVETINIFNLDDEINRQIVMEIRLPRTIAAIASGMSLGLSGLLIQLSMKNPIADTNLLGFQSGATLFVLIVILLVPSLVNYIPLIAFIGGMLVYIIVLLITYKLENRNNIIVVGIAISAIVRSFINLITLINSDDIENTLSYTSGSLTGVNLDEAMIIFWLSLFAISVVVIFRKQFEFNLLDDELLLNAGINYNVVRLTTATVAIFLSTISVCYIGTIGFVGILAPHIARKLTVNTATKLIPTTILVGAILVAGGDLLQRVLVPIYEIPVGIIMSVAGGVMLIILLLRSDDVEV